MRNMFRAGQNNSRTNDEAIKFLIEALDLKIMKEQKNAEYFNLKPLLLDLYNGLKKLDKDLRKNSEPDIIKKEL